MGSATLCSHEPWNERCIGGPLSSKLVSQVSERIQSQGGEQVPTSSQNSTRTAISPVLAKRPAPAFRAPSARVSSWTSSFRVVRVAMDDALVVRSGPSEFHAAVGVIPVDGDGVQIVGDCRELWCPVRYDRLAGWVNRSYLAEVSSPLDAKNETRMILHAIGRTFLGRRLQFGRHCARPSLRPHMLLSGAR